MSTSKGRALYRERHRTQVPVEKEKPAGTLEAGAQLYRLRQRQIDIEPAEHRPDNLGGDAA